MIEKDNYPEIVFLRRKDKRGYGFFYRDYNDFIQAAKSFTDPVLRSFKEDPIPGQINPQDHLQIALKSFLSQAFTNQIPQELGAEGASRAVAACLYSKFTQQHSFKMPKIIILEQKNKTLKIRDGLDYHHHPGYPKAIIVTHSSHGGDAFFNDSQEDYSQLGQSPPSPHCWLPQILYRLYEKTPSVMIGTLRRNEKTNKAEVECRGLKFNQKAALIERATSLAKR
jgi:hypothetical protein